MKNKRIYILLCIILICCTPRLSFSEVAPITTEGNQVLIGGEQGSLAGNSFFWSNFGGDAYYNANVVNWLKQDWNTTIVRAAIGVEEFNGYLSNPNLNRNALVAVVEAAIANDMYVIIDWHTHNAESNTQAAVNFFSEMAQTYGGNNNVIFEIYNEPIGDFNNPQATWNSIKSYAEPVISAIRQHSDNLIVVGTPFFSQRVDTASESPITGVDNLAYTLHFYAGTHGESLRQTATTALNNGIPLFVTEWGAVNADGNGAVNENSTLEWMAFLEDNNISHLNWAVNDKNEGASVLIGTEQGANNQGKWPLSLLTPSGLLTRNIIRDWPSIEGTPQPQGTTIPGLIEAEDYDQQVGVRTENTNDEGGGLNIGYISNNDYVEYNVNVQQAGTYQVSMRLASQTTGGDIRFNVDGSDTNSDFSVGNTGGWQNWTTVTRDVFLSSGQHTLRFIFTHPTSNNYLLNVNWIDFQANTDVTLPTLIQAENFVRQSGTRSENTSDQGGGLNIGYIENDDYLEYDVTIAQEGTYQVSMRLASATSGGDISFDINDSNTNAGFSIDGTGGWQNWTTVNRNVFLPSGQHTLRFTFTHPSSTNGLMNVNWINFASL